MPKVAKTPKEKNVTTANIPFDWSDFVSSIIQGEYVLLIGSEVMLQKEYGSGDATKDLLGTILDDLKDEGLLGHDKSFSSFTELARGTGRSDSNIRDLIIKTLIGETPSYVCSTDAISTELKNLIRTKFFRFVMTTTYDMYLENLMEEVWGKDGFRVMNIFDEGRRFDFDEKEQSSAEFDVKPTLYYICGRVNNKRKKFVATENDAIEVVARWFSNKAPTNFLNSIRKKGVISIGCKFDDWLFRFFWYVLRKNVNNIDSSLKDAVAVSFSSESDIKLKGYLTSKNVYTESDSRQFIQRILNFKDQCVKNIAAANTQLGGVFISYAHEDMPLVSSIVKRLKEDEGFNVWFDSYKLESGDSYNKRIANAIANCKIFVPILSPQVRQDLQNGATDRYYISTEWALAIQRAKNIGTGMRIMPLAVSGYDEMSSYHGESPFYDMTTVNLMNTPISRFVNEIKKFLS